jgi:predicted DCC family thiol-disulfide oxidoreductase YuxK
MNRYKHLIFFDSKCPLCKSSVKKIIQIDRKKVFCFSPLTGSTAKNFFKNNYQSMINLNSLVLVENFSMQNKKTWTRSKGFFRILWLVGRWYKFIGALYILPAYLTNWIYIIIARHRHKFFKEQDHKSFHMEDKTRFLP